MKRYDRHGTLQINEILPFVTGDSLLTSFNEVRKCAKIKLEIDHVTVSLSSTRLSVFKNSGVTCKFCGLVGEYFAIEKGCPTDENFHLNLYAINNEEEIMMTKYCTGKDEAGRKQYATSCEPCNRLNS